MYTINLPIMLQSTGSEHKNENNLARNSLFNNNTEMALQHIMADDVAMDYLISVLEEASNTWHKTREALKATQEYQMYYNMYKYLGNGPTLEDKVNDVFMLLPEWAAYQDADKSLQHAQTELALYQMGRHNVFRGGWSLSAWI